MERTLPKAPAGLAKADLGFASVILGGVWTTGAVLLAVSTRGRSVQAVLAMGCLVGTIGCAMLTLAFFPKLTQWLRIVGWLSVVAGSLLAVAVVWSVWELPPDQLQWFADPGDALSSSDRAVSASLIMLTASISLITTRFLSNQASRNRFAPSGSVQAIFLLFWRQHKLVGWMALALAAAHSVYFLRYPRTFEEQWTGIAAFVLLGVLGVVGLVTSYRTRLRLWLHRGIAAGLAVILTLHWPPILYLEIGALLILGITALVNLKLATLIVQRVLME